MSPVLSAVQFLQAIPDQLRLGEGALCSSNSFYCVDIEAGRLFQLFLDPNHAREHSFDSMLGTVALTERGRLLVALEGGIKLFSFDDGSVVEVAHPEQRREGLGIRYNDGRPGPDGRFYVGSMYKDPTVRGLNPHGGKLWRIDTDGSTTELLQDCDIPNGMAWKVHSDSEATMYRVVSCAQQLQAFDHDLRTGDLSNRRVITQFSDAYPDGMAIAQDGRLLVAMFNGSRVAIVDPTSGKETDRISLPAPQVTSVALCHSIAYVTTATEGYDDAKRQLHPRHGRVFKVDVATLGLVGTAPYKFDDRYF